MSESKVEAEILGAVKIRARRGETRQDYLDRVMRAVVKLTDDEWNTLSTEAQNWTNAAAEAVKASKDIVEFADDAVNEQPVEEAAEQEEEAAPAKKTRSSKSNGTRKISACHKIKTFVVKNPKITVDALSEKLKEVGLKVSDVTIATIRSDTRDTLRVLNDANMISVEL